MKKRKKRTGKSKSRKSRPKLRLISRIALILNILFSALLLLSWISTYIDPSKFWPAAFIAILYPGFIIINLLFVLAWLIRLRWFFLISLVPVALSFNLLAAHFNIRGSSKSIEGPSEVKVLSYNVHAFNKNDYYNSKDAKAQETILNYIYSEDPDIICMQEFYSNPSRNFAILDSFNMMQRLPNMSKAFYREDWKTMYMAIFTKYPVEASGVLQGPDQRNYGHWIDVRIDGQISRIINVHLRSLKLSSELTLLDNVDPDFYNDENFKKGARTMLGKMKRAFILRVTQSNSLKDFISKSPHPIVLCGDFNDTPASYTYRQLQPYLNDAFSKSGFGAVKTYNGPLPYFRIDYIMASPSFRINSCVVKKIDVSDHFPMTATIQLKGKD